MSTPILNAQNVTNYCGVAYSGGGNFTVTTATRDTRNFSRPHGVVVDAVKNVLYVSHEHGIVLIQGNSCYNRSGYSGNPTSGAGHNDQTGIAARYDRPAGMALTPGRRVIIADKDNSVIRELDSFVNISNNAPVTTVSGVPSFLGGYKDAANSSAEFSSPLDVAVNGSDVYVADMENHCIRKISNGTTTTLAGNASQTGSMDGTGTAAQFYLPSGLFLENSNSLLVADYGNQSIRRINLTTKAVTTVVTGLKGPRDICAVNGKIYITDKTALRVYDGSSLTVYAGSTTQSGNVEGIGTTARFTELMGIDYHPNEKAFYVVDQGVNVVKKVSTSSPPVANFTESTNAASVGQTVVLTDVSTNSPTSWEWTITPSNYTLLLGSSLTDKVVYLAFTQANSYSITLKATSAEGTDQITKNNHINVSTSASQITTADFDATNKTPATNEVITLVDLSSYSPSAWEWTITPAANVTFESGTTNASQFPKVSFSDKGEYTVKLKATNVNGNDEEEKISYITVDYPVSIKENNALKFTVYPNPVKQTLYILGGNSAVNSKVELLNINGAVIKTIYNSNEIDVNELPNGLYLVRVTNNNMVGVKKVLKN